MQKPVPGRERRFFVGRDEQGLCLADEELHHAVHVNRLEAGDQLWGLDGQGSARRMRVLRVGRRRVDLEDLGEMRSEAPAGTPGATLAHVELGVALPKPAQLEAMVDRLTQLGLARLRPLLCERSSPSAREWSLSKHQKLERSVRQAMKQSARLWPMEIAPPLPLQAWLTLPSAPATYLLDTAPSSPLVEMLRSQAPGAALRLAIGPEGGWTPSEASLAPRVHLRGHILRTETAAELAAGMALQFLLAPNAAG